ncbi:MAG TPA: DUF4271 domain-containing protein [Chitinophagaceae bacterium]
MQSLIDSAKVEVSKRAPAIKDSSRRVVKPVPVKVDTGKAIIPFHDTASTVKKPASNVLRDSLQKDSVATASPAISVSKPLSWEEDSTFIKLLELSVVKTKSQSLFREEDLHQPQRKEYLFYMLVGIVLLLAITKQLFPRYFHNLFLLMFQASFRQRQTREQMMLQVLPSLLMNIFFVVVAGSFIALLADIHDWLNTTFWWLTLYSISLLALVYIFKYLVIQFMGWVFNAKEQASTYGFIVFLVNKVLALVLLPLLFLFAFSTGHMQDVILTIAACIVILLLIFRYIISLTIIRRALSIHPLHFFIYLCGIELMPMFIMYKVMFSYIGNSN